MEQNIQVEAPVGVGPARDFVDLDELDFEPFGFKRSIEWLEEVEDEIGNGFVRLIELDHEHFGVELHERHLTHDHVVHRFRRTPDGSRVVVELRVLLHDCREQLLLAFSG